MSERLKKENCENINIIFIDFMDLEYEEIKEYHALHSYMEEHYQNCRCYDDISDKDKLFDEYAAVFGMQPDVTFFFVVSLKGSFVINKCCNNLTVLCTGCLPKNISFVYRR